MEKMKNIYDEELKRREAVTYTKEVIGDKQFLRNNPEYLDIELQKRILHSQTPKRINIIMLILVALTLIVSVLSLLHSYSII